MCLCRLLLLVIVASSEAATFSPYLYDAFITNRVDLDGDSYARQFDIAFDVDSNISGQCYVRIYEYDGGFGFDDLLLTTVNFTVSGTTTDYRFVRITCSDYPGVDLLSHGTAEIRLDLYNAANNTLVQSWTPSDDSDLGNVLVELANEDSVPVLTITSIAPSGLQTRGWEQSVTYTITVRNTNGIAVSGATLFATNNLVGTTFTSSPATTDANGQITYTTTVAVCTSNAAYDIFFVASKPGYLSSQPVLRQLQVSQPPNRPPLASATLLTGQPPVLRIGEVYSVTADYTDPDGPNDIRLCLLRLGHPTTPLAFYYDVLTSTVQPLSANLQTFISPVTVERTEIANGLRLVWHFFLKRTWPLTTSQIDFAVGAQDRCGLTDGWNSDRRSLAFENPLYGCTLIVHGYQLASSSVPEWVKTMGGRIADRLGSGEVYEYMPATGSFVRHPDLSVGTNAAFEKVFLFNWSDESDNLSTGFAEAAADAFVAALVQAQLTIPSDHFLNRIHLIGHSRGCVVGSEMIERLRTFSTHGEDTNLFGYCIDAQIDATWLDPHTTGTTLTGDFGDPNVNSPQLTNRGVVVWNNVGHANNYYQDQNDATLFFYLDGEFVRGSRNRNLDSPVPVGIDHTEVHAWYFGTIDPEATQDELAAMIIEERANAEAADFMLTGLTPEPDGQNAAMLANVTLRRQEWYLDGMGIIEGYAHTRPGGEISHNASREPLDLTPRQEAFHDLIADGIFNGNFDHGAGQVLDLPAWDRHSGGGGGMLDSGHLRLYGSEGAPEARYRRHNLLFIPSNVESLYFRLRIYEADSRPIPNADHLLVRLGNTPILGSLGKEVWLNQTSSSFKIKTCEIPVNLRGTVNTLTFEIVPGGSSVNAEVWIDDVTWLDESYLRLTVTRLSGGQVQLDMRGQASSQYVIEASADLSNWSQLTVVTNMTGNINYIDSQAAVFQHRFYRAVSLP